MSINPWDQFKKAPVSTWTSPLTAIYGAYQWLNNRPIHYFLTSLSASNIWDDVLLMDQMRDVEKWGFEALFQRAIRDEWVYRIKSQYLNNPARFKFFPPVTIALLPCANDAPKRQYDPPAKFELIPNSGGGYCAEIAGLKLTFPTVGQPVFPDFGQPTIIQWDKSQYAALAIDGQHRISALRSFIPRDSQGKELKDIPATILIFDPDLPPGRDLVQLTREIFIDINKNAKTVDESRLILLDDRNFFSALTRKLILQAYPDGETPSPLQFKPLNEDTFLELPDGIPQELVDTAAGRESADVTRLREWHFTSAFIIHKALRHFVFEDDFKKFEDLLETHDYSRDSDEELESVVAQRRLEYESNGQDDESLVIPDHEMLSFRPDITEQLANRALRMHGSLIIGAFTAFQPYREHIGRLSQVIDTPDGNLIRSILLSEGTLQKKDKQEYETKVSKELKEHEPERFKIVKKAVANLAKPKAWEDSLVWYSVFQRGLLYQPGLIRRAMELARGKVFQSREKFAENFVFALNTLYTDGWFDREAQVDKKQIWNGIARKIGVTGDPAMDGSDGAAKRIGLFVRLMVSAVMARDNGGYKQVASCSAKQGFSNARTNVVKGLIRYEKARLSAANELKSDEYYDTYASQVLESVLREISDISI